MAEIFSWDSYVLIFPFYVTSSNDGVRVKSSGGTGFSVFFTTGNSIMWGQAVSGVFTAQALLTQLAALLKSAHDSLYSVTTGSFSVILNQQLKIEITNNSPNDLIMDFGSFVFDSKDILGFGSETSTVILEGNGGKLTAGFQPYGLWTPHFHYTRDTAHDEKTVKRKSVTESGRPSYTTHSDAHSIRRLAWDFIGSALVKYARTKDSLFCSTAGVSVNDPNCYLQKWFNYITSGSGPLPGRCYVAPKKDSTITLDGDTGSGYLVGAGPYWVNIPDEAVCGIGEEWLNQETAVESYNIYVDLRLQTL